MPFLDKEGLKYLLDNLAIKGGGGTGGEGGTSNYFAFNINDTGNLILTYEGETQPNFEIVDNGHLYYYLDPTKTSFVDLGKVVGDGEGSSGSVSLCTSTVTDDGEYINSTIALKPGLVDWSTEDLTIRFFDGDNKKNFYSATGLTKDTTITDLDVVEVETSFNNIVDSTYFSRNSLILGIYKHSLSSGYDSTNDVLIGFGYVDPTQIAKRYKSSVEGTINDYSTRGLYISPEMSSTCWLGNKMMGDVKTCVINLTLKDFEYFKTCASNLSIFRLPGIQQLTAKFGENIWTRVAAEDRQLPTVYCVTDEYDHSLQRLYFAPRHQGRTLYSANELYTEFDIICLNSYVPSNSHNIEVPSTDLTNWPESRIYNGWVIAPTSV